MYFFLNKTIILEIKKNKGLAGVFKFFLNQIKKIFYIFFMILVLKRQRKNYTPESLIDFVFLKFEGILEPLQIRFEILKLIKIINNYHPNIIIEIGTARGGTLFLFSKVASKNALIISIDLPGGSSGRGYPKLKIPLYKSFILKTQKLFLIRGNSHDINVLNKVKTILNGKKVNFLFIDGDHTYFGVKKDFEMYSSLVDNKGIIGLHDIKKPDCSNPKTGVYKFWAEIKKDFTYEEIIDASNKNCIGIGILKGKKNVF